jgi:penicillin-binding protein 1A
MAKYKYLEETEAEHYKSMPLMLSYQLINYSQGPAPYLMERLRPQLLEWCSSHTKADGTPYNLYTDGLKIYTTINYDMQVTAEKAIEEQMAKLQDVFDEHWGGKIRGETINRYSTGP